MKWSHRASMLGFCAFVLSVPASEVPLTGGSAKLTFDLAPLLSQTPLAGLDAIFGITQTRDESLSLPGNNPSPEAVWALNLTGAPSPSGRVVQETTLKIDPDNVLASWSPGNDVGPFLTGGEQIGFGGMTRWTLDPGINGVLLFGDWGLRHAPGRAGTFAGNTPNIRSGLVLTSNIDFPSAVYADIANVSISTSGGMLRIRGDLLISDGLIVLGFPNENFGLDIGEIAIDAPFAGSCPADLNNDSLVDDADFVIFAAAYNILDCADPSMPAGCTADLNADGLVDDADFVVFVLAYDALLCP